MFRKLFYIFWSVLLALEIFISPTSVKADENYQTISGSACEFQPPAATRVPTVSVIRQIQGGSNITWDNSFIGLHRWNTSQWPGVDYLVPTTVPFKNGGTVDIAGWDGAGGGNSLFIKGEGPCAGWYVFIGHLAYSPGSRFTRGQHIGPDEIIGEPGCSGFENNCADKGSRIPPHNHYTLGYSENIFNFSDGTVPAQVKRYYWIHPARVEGTATGTNPAVTVPIAPTEALTVDFSEAEFIDSTNGPIIEMAPEWTMPKRLPFRMPLWAYPVLTFSLCVLFTKHYKPLGVAGISITVLFLFAFYYITPASAAEPVPQAVFVEEDFTFETVPAPTQPNTTPEVVMNEEGKPSKNPADYPLNSTPCRVSSKAEARVLEWCGLITYYADLNGLDPDFIAAVVTQESHGNPEPGCQYGTFEVNGIKMCGSEAGAMGLMQVMPSDGRSQTIFGNTFVGRHTSLEFLNADTNIRTGTHMLKGMGAASNMRESLVPYGGDYSGKPRFNRYYYADKVMNIYRSLK